jgi:hypothetical protein
MFYEFRTFYYSERNYEFIYYTQDNAAGTFLKWL